MGFVSNIAKNQEWRSSRVSHRLGLGSADGCETAMNLKKIVSSHVQQFVMSIFDGLVFDFARRKSR